MTRRKRAEWVRMVLVALAAACLAVYVLAVHSGCKGQQWALKSQAIIHAKFPELEAANCAERFPVRADTSVGTPLIYASSRPGLTVYTNCDSAFKLVINAVASGLPAPVDLTQVPADCPPGDSVVVPKYITILDQAALKAEQLAHKTTKAELEKTKGKLNSVSWAAGILGVLVIGLAIIVGRLIKFK